MSAPLHVVTDGPTQIWTISMPGVGNAITGNDFIAAFETAVDAANADTSVRAVILTGEGKIFSAGGNVKEMADRDGMFGLDALDQLPHDDLLAQARALAERITKNPAHAPRMAKRLLQESRTGSLETTLGMAAAMQPLAQRDREHEQRIAKWKSR